MPVPPNKTSPHLLEFYWSPETRRRLGLDGELPPGAIRVLPSGEPYDMASVLGVEMTMVELRALLQRFVAEERKTQPAAALRRVAERVRAKAKTILVKDEIARSVMHWVAEALEEEAAELGR